jgi:hypothetical protein
MKTYLLLFTLLLSGMAGAQKTPVGFGKMYGFSLRPGKEPPTGLETQLFARKSQFDEYFVQTPGQKASKTDFSRFVALTCRSARTNVETSITLEKVEKYDGVMEIFFRVTYGKKLAKSYVPVAVYSTGIDKSLTGMIFYVNGQMVMDLRN